MYVGEGKNLNDLFFGILFETFFWISFLKICSCFWKLDKIYLIKNNKNINKYKKII